MIDKRLNDLGNGTTNGHSTNGAVQMLPAPSRRAAKPQAYDWMGAVLRRKVILVFCVTIAALLGYLYYVKQPRVYASNIKLMIWTQAPPRIVEGENLVQPVSTGKHVNLIRSEVVLNKAVEDGDLGKLRTFLGNSAPMYALKGMVEVQPVDGAADTLLITARGPEPTDLPSILTSVVAAYQEIISEDSQAISKSSAELIEKLQDQITAEKSDTEERFTELIKKLGISPDPASGTYVNPYFTEITELKTQKSQREREFRQMTEKIASVKDVQGATAADADELLRVIAIEAARYLSINGRQESGTMSDRGQLIQRLSQRIEGLEATLTELRLKSQRVRRSVGDKHPSAASINGEIETYSNLMAILTEQRRRLQSEDLQASKAPATKKLSTLTNIDREIIQIYLAALQRESDRLENSLKALDDDILDLEKKANVLNGEIQELNFLASQIKEKDQDIREILDRISSLTLLASNYTSTKVRVIDNPGNGYQVAPKLLNSILPFILVGGLLGIGLIVLLDWSDLSFRNPNEIKEKLGIPVIARIAKMPAEANAAGAHSNRLITIDKPKSPVAEAYRACKTSMLFLCKQHNMNCFLITSPSAGDGKSTTALNLAVSFAQAGMQTVIVDGDLRRPRCHAYLGVDVSPGLKDFSVGDATETEIIRESKLQPNLSFVTAGRHFSNPSEFLDSAQFSGFLAQLKESFDIVIVDSPPVLPVADAMTLSGLCDGVMLVMKIRKGVVLSSEKAVETLQRVNANLLGVIVNQTEKVSHYSDYGKYGYSGYGGYAYYAGRYYDKQNDKYYETEVVPDIEETK